LAPGRSLLEIILEQTVFGFLADDPTHQEAVRTERIWRTVIASFDENLEDKVSRIVEETLEKLAEAACDRKHSDIVADLGRIHLSLAHGWTLISEDEPADWWKEGYDWEEEKDEFLP
jgi:hypothetical protein